MSEKIKIIVADDHPVLNKGIVQILSQRSDFEVIGEAIDGYSALNLIREKTPDIAILDVQMPNMDGFEVAKVVMAEKLVTKIVFLTMYKEESFIKKVFDIGVKGYILKESAVIDIIRCIDEVNEGNFYLSPKVSHFLLDINVGKKEKAKKVLTSSEENILQLISKGRSSKEIAEELYITVKTVENHRSNICKKLGITGNAALLKYALKKPNSFL